MTRTSLRRPLLVALTVLLLLPVMALAADPTAPSNTGPTVVVPNEKILDRISWSAVAAGALVALAIHIALSTLGVGVGAGAIDPYDKHPIKGVPTTVLAWMFVSGLVALFVGGWVSGRLANTVPFDSAIQGVIVWSFATVVLVLLAMTSMGYVVGGTFRLLGAGASAIGAGVSAAGSAAGTAVSAAAHLAKDVAAEAMPSLDWKGIQREARKVLHIGNGSGNDGNQQGNQGGQQKGQQGNQGGQQKGQQGGNNNQQGGSNQQGGQNSNQQGNNQQGNNQQGGNQNNNQQGQHDNHGGQSGLQGAWDETQDLVEMLTKAYGAVRDGGLSNADRDTLMTAIRERAGISEEEANRTLEKWEKMYKEAKQQYDVAVAKAEAKAREVAAAATSAVSRIAVWTFASLILGVTVAAIGGNLGSVWFRL